MRAVVRVTAAPIVESLPCVGGVSLTLLKSPHFDASFRIAGSFDFMALPFLHEAIQYGTKVGPIAECSLPHYETIHHQDSHHHHIVLLFSAVKTTVVTAGCAAHRGDPAGLSQQDGLSHHGEFRGRASAPGHA